MRGNVMLCNGCGRPVPVNGVERKDALRVRKEWGYFSTRDLEIHEFLLCEECYDDMIGNFVIPVKVSQIKEVLKEEESFS